MIITTIFCTAAQCLVWVWLLRSAARYFRYVETRDERMMEKVWLKYNGKLEGDAND